MRPNSMSLSTFESSLGWFGLTASRRGVTSLTFGHRTKAEVLQILRADTSFPDSPDWLALAEQLLREFAKGLPADLHQIPLDLPPATQFQSSVREVVREIPFGESMSYGEVAAAVGRPGAARAVGTVMSQNPVPLLIPCHRVLGSGGKLGGYSAPSGLEMKRLLLDLESESVECLVR